jgi:hypothetical protein
MRRSWSAKRSPIQAIIAVVILVVEPQSGWRCSLVKDRTPPGGLGLLALWSRGAPGPLLERIRRRIIAPVFKTHPDRFEAS